MISNDVEDEFDDEDAEDAEDAEESMALAHDAPLVAYADDTAAWATQQADLLRTARFGDLDITNLAEEIESLAKRDRHEIVSRLIVLQAHLLKEQYQPEVASKSWRNTIREQVRQIERTLRGSPSLRREMPDFILEAYPDARSQASDETDVSLVSFPATMSDDFAFAVRATLAGEEFVF